MVKIRLFCEFLYSSDEFFEDYPLYLMKDIFSDYIDNGIYFEFKKRKYIVHSKGDGDYPYPDYIGAWEIDISNWQYPLDIKELKKILKLKNLKVVDEGWSTFNKVKIIVQNDIEI